MKQLWICRENRKKSGSITIGINNFMANVCITVFLHVNTEFLFNNHLLTFTVKEIERMTIISLGNVFVALHV